MKTGMPSTPSDESITTSEKPLVIQFPGSLRDWFAGQALQGWIAGPCAEAIDEYDDDDVAFAEHQAEAAKACYGYADAMLRERARE